MKQPWSAHQRGPWRLLYSRKTPHSCTAQILRTYFLSSLIERNTMPAEEGRSVIVPWNHSCTQETACLLCHAGGLPLLERGTAFYEDRRVRGSIRMTRYRKLRLDHARRVLNLKRQPTAREVRDCNRRAPHHPFMPRSWRRTQSFRRLYR